MWLTRKLPDISGTVSIQQSRAMRMRRVLRSRRRCGSRQHRSTRRRNDIGHSVASCRPSRTSHPISAYRRREHLTNIGEVKAAVVTRGTEREVSYVLLSILYHLLLKFRLVEVHA